MSQDQLAAILKKGDTKACLAFFANLPEKERQSYSGQALSWFKPVNANFVVEIKPGSFTQNPLLPAAQVAVLAACSWSQLRKLGWRGLPSQEELAFDVLVSRRPAWLDEWAEWLCEQQPRWWSLVRKLMHAGMCRKPMSDHYILGMIVDLCPYHENRRTIYDALLSESDLLQEDIWRLFEVQGTGDLSLAARDKYCRKENTWNGALIRLAAEKKIDRARLLDACLAALQRDFSQFHAGWFSQLHEALQPSVAERAQRIDTYLALLASRIPPTVSFALKALQILDKDNKVGGGALLTSIGPALWNRHKGTVKLAMQLLQKIIRKEPSLTGQLGNVVAEALNHESPEVHAMALDLLEKYAQPISAELALVLQDRLAGVAASQRQRLQTLLAASDPKTTEQKPLQDPPAVSQIKTLRKRADGLEKKWRKLAGLDTILSPLDQGHVNIQAINFDPMAIPRLDPDKRIVPIANLDELIEVFARVLEKPDDPMEVERVLDGVSRLGDQKPEDFSARTGPLRKRALDRLARIFSGPFIGCGLLVDLCGLARAWLCGEVIMPEKVRAHKFDGTLFDYTYTNSKNKVEFFVYYQPTVRTFLSMRVLAIARRCSMDDAAPLLAAPTHAGGWIDPLELARRTLDLQAFGKEADPVDQIQALLRLAPDQRGPALKGCRKITGEFGQALRYALGGDEKIGPTTSLWVAAARARSPFADDGSVAKKHPGIGPDAGQAAQYQPEIKKRPGGGDFYTLKIQVEPRPPAVPQAEIVTVLMNPQMRKEGEFYHSEVRESVEDLRWMMTVWPAQRESWFARAALPFAENLDWWEAVWSNRTYLEPLLDPDVPLRPMALLMLTLGLGAKDPGESGLATDALIAAIDDGRLDGEILGQAMAFLGYSGLVKLPRWARTLGQASGIAPLHRQVISQAIQVFLRECPAEPPKDLHTLLEILKEGLVELGSNVSDTPARVSLEKIQGAGKTSRLAHDLLHLEVSPQAQGTGDIWVRALEKRIERAESWARRTKKP